MAFRPNVSLDGSEARFGQLGKRGWIEGRKKDGMTKEGRRKEKGKEETKEEGRRNERKK